MIKDFFRLKPRPPEGETRDFVYCMAGGWSEIIEAGMIDHGIDAEYCESDTGRRIWRVQAGQVHLLPKDTGPYMGDREMGFGVWDISDQEAERMRNGGRFGDWTPVVSRVPGPTT